MKKALFATSMVLAVLFAGCKSSKKAVATPYDNEVEVVVPCKEFKTDKTAIRANGNAISPNMQNATDKALAAARRELGTSVSTTLQRVLDTYVSSYETDQAADYKAKYQDMARQVVNQMLQGSVAVCDKVTKTRNQDGSVMYHAYVAVEMGVNDLVSEIKNKVSKDDQLRIDFEYERFKKTFEAEMEKYGN